MNGGRNSPVFRGKHLAAVFGETKLRPEQVLRSGRSEADNYLRLHGLNLDFEPGTAGRDFERIRLFVKPDLAPWFPLEMLHCIGDVDLAAINSCRFQALVQELPGRPDKRPSLLIFTIPGLLSDQEQCCVDAALAEHYLGGLLI